MNLNQNKAVANARHYGLIDPMVKTLCNYVDFNDIKTVYDVGSRDGLQSQELSVAFPDAKIFAFEPNPEATETCISNTKGNSQITLYKVAVSNVTGDIDFFAADMGESRDPNIGISSIFKLMDQTPRGWHWVQKKITVPSITLDDFVKAGNPPPELIWIDVQGAELLVFQGAKTVLPNVKAIFTEAGKRPYYHGHGMINEIDAYLKLFGFHSVLEVPGHEYESDFLYVK